MTELMEDLDANLIYIGAKRISEYEAELLEQLDESFDYQIKMQIDLESAIREKKEVQENLKKTDDAISTYCSETTKNKILLARGWQFMHEEAQAITEALSDKELLERISKTNEQKERKRN